MVSAEFSGNGDNGYASSAPICSFSSCEHVPKTKPWLSIRCLALVGLSRLAVSGSSPRFLLVVVMGFKAFFGLMELPTTALEVEK